MRRHWGVLGVLWAACVAAQEPATHVVQRGETLWGIAQQYLADPFLWPEIFRLNADAIRDPARIYPGQVLRLPILVAPAVAAEGRDTAAGPVIRFAEEEPPRAVTPGEFYGAEFLAAENEVVPLGQVAELRAPSVVQQRIAPQIQLYDRVYVALRPGASVRLGDRLHLVRRQRRLIPYGWVYVPTGVATVAALDGATATAVIVQMFDAVAVGDWAVAVPEFRVPVGAMPTPGGGRLEGRVIAFAVPHPVPSTKDRVVLNVGRAHGVNEGDEFVVVLPPERRRWGVRPEIEVARVRVLRVMERTATARITELQQPALRLGLPARRVAQLR